MNISEWNEADGLTEDVNEAISALESGAPNAADNAGRLLRAMKLEVDRARECARHTMRRLKLTEERANEGRSNKIADLEGEIHFLNMVMRDDDLWSDEPSSWIGSNKVALEYVRELTNWYAGSDIDLCCRERDGEKVYWVQMSRGLSSNEYPTILEAMDQFRKDMLK